MSNNSDNLFHLCLSLESYLINVGIWVGVFLIIVFALFCAFKHSKKAANKLSLFLIIICPINIFDYGIRSFCGPVGGWPKSLLILWSVFTLTLPLIALFAIIKTKFSDKFFENFIKVSIAPCILLLLYGFQTSFIDSTISKKPVYMDGNPAHLILFDMLSYDLLFQGSQVDQRFLNFKEFSIDCDVFLSAKSPGKTTGQTIPRLFAGSDLISVGHDRDTPWLIKPPGHEDMIDLAEYENILSIFHDANYNIFLQAFAMPYTKAFSRHIQFGKVYPYDTLWRIGFHSLIWPIIYPGGLAHQRTADSILENYKAGIFNNPPNTFYYTHWNIPHPPFIYDSTGGKLSRWELIKRMVRKDNKEGFLHQLVGTDLVFGEVISAMKQSGKYDKSLIIVIADTNAKGFGFDSQHVPLFIKRPYQSEQRIVYDAVQTIEIKEYLKAFLHEHVGKNFDLEFERLNL